MEQRTTDMAVAFEAVLNNNGTDGLNHEEKFFVKEVYTCRQGKSQTRAFVLLGKDYPQTLL
jgi:hypothetical protein